MTANNHILHKALDSICPASPFIAKRTGYPCIRIKKFLKDISGYGMVETDISWDFNDLSLWFSG